MKFCLLLSFFCFILLARSQSTLKPDNGSAWRLAPPVNNTVYEKCWPKDNITVSYNDSGIIFTADEWMGDFCTPYNLYQESSIYIADGSEYGYFTYNNNSLQFNYQVFNSSSMMLTFWFGCFNCNNSVNYYFTNETIPACNFTISTVPFNTCPFADNNTTFTIPIYSQGNLIFSLGAPNVPNCAGTQNIWAVFHSGFTGCQDVAIQYPLSNFQYPVWPLNGGITLTYPPTTPNSTSLATFQLNLSLGCFLTDYNVTGTSFTLLGMSTNASTGLTTFNVWGPSGYGCVQSGNDCPPVVVGNTVYDYNACLLNQTLYTVKDPLGGVLTFNFGNTPAVANCASSYSQQMVFGIYQTAAGLCLTAADETATYDVLNQTNPSQGLLLTFGQGMNQLGIPVVIKVSLLCDSEVQVEDVVLDPMMSVNYVLGQGSMNLQVTGSSPYACVAGSTNYTVWNGWNDDL